MSAVSPQPLNFVIVTDPGPDPDDVKVIAGAAFLHSMGVINVKAVICNGGGQAYERAKLGKAVVRLCAQPDIRVGIGSAGVDRDPLGHEYDLDGWDAVAKDDLEDGKALFLSVLREAAPKSLIVQCQAALTDVADMMKEDGDLFLEKVHRVSIMGGLQRPSSEAAPSLDADEMWKLYEADTAQNNVFDMDAARFVYDFCLARSLQMHIVGRDAVPMLPMSVATSHAKKHADSDLLRYLGEAQSRGLVQLWAKVCSGTELPARCSKEWFFVTFCGVSEERYRAEHADLDAQCNIVEYLHGSVKPYDVVSFMTNIPSQAEHFDFESAEVTIGDAKHYFFLKPSQAIDTDAVSIFLSEVFEDVGVVGKAVESCFGLTKKRGKKSGRRGGRCGCAIS
eukprot:g6950.t1